MIEEVTKGLEAYDLQAAISPMIDFVDSLNNWYIRRSRRRFWKSENDADKNNAYHTLYRVLRRLTFVMAPVIPFVTEAIYQNIKLDSEPESIHLCSWPVAETAYRDFDLERDMAIVRQAVSMGRSLRVANDLKIRQPLSSIQLITRNSKEREALLRMEDILREELNVKQVIVHEEEEDLVRYHAKANFKVLGKELGADMKEAAARIAQLDSERVKRLLDGEEVMMTLSSGKTVRLDTSRLDIIREEKEGLKVLNEGTLTVALDTTITPELLSEGYVRDLIRAIQNARKEAGLDVTDRIVVTISGDEALHAALDRFSDMVKQETLAVRIEWRNPENDDSHQDNDLRKSAFRAEAGDKVWSFTLRKA